MSYDPIRPDPYYRVHNLTRLIEQEEILLKYAGFRMRDSDLHVRKVGINHALEEL